MSTMARTRLMKDIKAIEEDSLLGVSCSQDDKDPLQLNVVIFGGLGQYYENGIFKLILHFSEEYPFTPPVGKFESEIFHPNINKNGNIDLDILQKQNWLPTYSLTSIVTSLKSLLNEPCPTWPYQANPEATDLFLENRSQYKANVKAIVEQSFWDNQPKSLCEINEQPREEA